MSKNLLFHEVYGSYYNVVAEILAEAVKGKLTRDSLMAIAREKALKKWNRAWKYRLIETQNPEWKDFAAEINEIIAHEKESEIS